ncbi:MAG: hypothetical protein IPJ82_23780 [Lewinellaceae bacterium]|nr:hypothetical protein [Lewinellaceae bacterium]
MAAEKDKTAAEIARLLREAEVFIRAEEWENAAAACRKILRLDPGNRDAADKLR